MVQKYLRPAAIKTGVIKESERVRFGFHNFRHSLASSLVKLKCDPKTVQGIWVTKTSGRQCDCMRSPTKNRGLKPRARSWHCCSETRLTCSQRRSSDVRWAEESGRKRLSPLECGSGDGVEPPTQAFSDWR